MVQTALFFTAIQAHNRKYEEAANPRFLTRVTMDITKYPIEKLFYFVAAVIPGFVALLIFQLAAPGSYDWFFAMGFLGYKTKLALIAVLAFVIGNTLTAFLTALLGGIGGAIGGLLARVPYKASSSYSVAPWRDPRWRGVLAKRLGAQAPKDTTLIGDELYKLRQAGVNLLPSNQQPAALYQLNNEKISVEMDDGNWAQWYYHYHTLVIQSEKKEFLSLIRHGINFNFETAALYTLVSAIFVPALRHWWCMWPASFWIVLLFAQEYAGLRQWKDQWSTLPAQISYLSESPAERTS